MGPPVIILGDEIAYDGDPVTSLSPELAKRIRPLLPGSPRKLTLLADDPGPVIRASGRDDLLVRVTPAARMDEGTGRTLIRFLAALAEQPALRAPRPVRLADGKWSAPLDLGGRPHRLTLFTWVPGSASPAESEFPEPDRLRAVGAFVARMHAAGATLAPDALRTVRRSAAGELLDPTGRFDLGASRTAFGPGPTPRLDAARARIEAALRAHAGPDRTGLVHGDLEPQNFVFDEEGRPGAIDFDEFGFGSLALDLLRALRVYALRTDHGALRERLFEGYAGVRPLPPGTREDADVLTAALVVAWLREALRDPTPTARARLEAIFPSVAERVLLLCGAGAEPEFRALRPDDSIEEMTDLLHRAYERLAAMGLNYVATYQDAATTRRRLAGGECWVGVEGGRIVATVVLKPPGAAGGCATYERPDVATFHQFAVAPELQGRGHGSRLLARVEERARALGAAELALDTAEGATHLIAYYERRGFRVVDHADWDVTNYRSVVMSKLLAP